MPDKKDSKQSSEDSKTFIKQTIVKDQKSILTWKNCSGAAVLAVVFGAVSTLTSLWLRPILQEKFFPPAQDPTHISIPKEELETETPTEPQETEPVEDIVASAIEKYNYTAKDLETMVGDLTQIAISKDSAIVMVEGANQTTDWFNNTLESEASYSGLVIAKTEGELVLLVPFQAVNGFAGPVHITFFDGYSTQAMVRGQDPVSGLSVLSVELSLLTEKQREIEPITLGNSYQLRRGGMLLAVGSPAGVVYSSQVGSISYIAKNVSITDGYTRMIYTDLKADSKKGTFLLDVSGELVGWLKEGTEGPGAVYGISDFKVLIENMTNQSKLPYFGVVAVEIPEGEKAQGLPEGLYVREVENDSPAYNTGIQAGDIIVQMNDGTIRRVSDLKNYIDKLSPGQAIHVKIKRPGRTGYTDLEFEAITGARG